MKSFCRAVLLLLGLGLFSWFVLAPALAHAATGTFTWTAVGDDGLEGRADHYEGRIDTRAPDTTNADSLTSWWVKAQPIPNLPLPSESGLPDSVKVDGLNPALTYWAVLLVYDEAGNISPYSNVAQWPAAPDTTPPFVPKPPEPVTDFHLQPTTGPAAASTHVWLFLGWTAPDSVISYQARSLDALGNPWTPTLRETPSLGSGPPIPDPGGFPDHAWCHWPKAGSPSTIVWLIGVNRYGLRSDSSNAVVIRAGVPADTNVFDVGGSEWVRSQPIGGVGVAFFQRPWGLNDWRGSDYPPWSALPPVPIQEEVQVAMKDQLCAEHGSWALRGVAMACVTGAQRHWYDVLKIWEWL